MKKLLVLALLLSIARCYASGPPQFFPIATNVTCFGGDNGSITVPFVIPFFPPPVGPIPGIWLYTVGASFIPLPVPTPFVGLTASTYNVRVFASNNPFLSATQSVIVRQPNQTRLLDYTMNPATCFEGTNGSLLITEAQIEGSTPPYTYSIGGPFQDVGISFENLGQGSYTVTIIDTNNCAEVVGEVTVQGPEEITLLNYTMIPATCFAGMDGSITISAEQVDGGRPGYTYSLGGPFQDIGEPFENLGQGSYTVTIQDSTSCQKVVGEVTVQGPEELTLLGYIQTPVTCFGGKDGMITISANQVAGGRPGYSYSLGGPFQDIGEPFTSLEQGSYTVTIQDSAICQNLVSEVTVQGPEEIRIIDLTIVPVSCNGGNDGSIMLLPSQIIGGIAPYSYSINGEFIPAGMSFTDLESGFYNVTIQDANNCTTVTIGVEIPEPSHIEIVRLITTPANCPDFIDGTLCIDTHSNTSLEYSINNGPFQNCPLFTDLTPGIYAILIRQRGVEESKCAVGTAVIDKKFEEFTDNDIGNFILRKYCPECIGPDS